MKVQSSRFGELKIEESKVIEMPDGMVGFEERRFIILSPEDGGNFCWLQSIDNPDLAFVVVEPATFIADYGVKLTREEYDKLQLEKGEEIILLAVTTMAPDPMEISVNLQGPIVINPAKMRGKQIVLEDGKYKTRHPLFQAIREGARQMKDGQIRRKGVAMTKVSAAYHNLGCATPCP